MKDSERKIKYFAYLRKSSEGTERQALSIPAQKDKLREQFGHLDLEFVEDRASAFKPHNRPAFADMMERIRQGERQGLITWHPDRLSRNETDAGQVTFMVRTGEIKDLKFGTYHFENGPEGIWMLQMALSQSQYESAKKGRDVKRGMEKKARMGMYPTMAPLGYMNDKYAERGSKTVLPDPDRFHLVRKMFNLMLTGNYPPAQILKIANEEWGYRTPKGNKLSHSNIYLLFSRPFYYGEFEYPVGSGNWHKGIHKPMITREEYDLIQALLGRPSSPRPRNNNFAYRGPLRCGECAAMITAERKTKRPKNGKVHRYTYYHCTKRKDPDCSQGSIEEKDLEKQIANELALLEIPEDFKEWALERLKEMNAKEVEDRDRLYGSQRRAYEKSVRKLSNLIDMRANSEIDETEFRERKEALSQEKQRLQDQLKDTDNRIDNWLEVAERGFDFAERARTAFINGSVEKKREILAALGSNLTIKDKKLNIDLDNVLFPIRKIAETVRAESIRLEPPQKPAASKENGPLYARIPKMLPG